MTTFRLSAYDSEASFDTAPSFFRVFRSDRVLARVRDRLRGKPSIDAGLCPDYAGRSRERRCRR